MKLCPPAVNAYLVPWARVNWLVPEEVAIEIPCVWLPAAASDAPVPIGLQVSVSVSVQGTFTHSFPFASTPTAYSLLVDPIVPNDVVLFNLALKVVPDSCNPVPAE